MAKRTGILYRLMLSALLPTMLALAACQSRSGTADTVATPIGGTPSAVANLGGTPSPGFGTAVPNGTAASAVVEISTTTVTIGGVVLTLSIDSAQPATDPARVSAASTDNQQTPVPQKGYLVLGETALKVTNNFDSAQSPPADQPREIVRHVSLQIRDKASNQMVPYVVVSMDLLRDGRPVLTDQPLVPMVAIGAAADQMQYGNNVRFPGAGEYQIFVRMQPSPLLSAGSAGAGQFNVSIR